MTMLYMNGFDQYGQIGDLLTDEDVVEISEDITGDNGYNIVSGGKYGTRTLLMDNGAHRDHWVTFGFSNSSKEVNIGLQVYNTDMDKPMMFRLKDNAGNVLFEIENGANTPDYNLLNGDGDLLEIIEGFSGQNWFLLELKVFIDSTFGSYVIFRNSVLVGSGAGINTSNTASFTDRVEQFQVRKLGFLLDSANIDDLWITNDQGSLNNDLMGGLAIVRIAPNDNYSVQWVPSHGEPNWASVDQVDGINSVDFNRGTYTGQKDLYHFTSPITLEDPQLPVLSTPAVQAQSRVSDISVTPGKYRLHLNSGSDENFGPEIQTTTGSESFATHMQILETTDGSSEWDAGRVADIRAGIEATK